MTAKAKLTPLLIAATAFPFSQALAQDALEEILVTARKKTESLQDVPISIEAFSAETIELLNIRSMTDLARTTPGLTFTKGIGGADTRPDLRGLTPLAGRSNVAILVDGVDMSTDSTEGTGAGTLLHMGLYDVERIEVVRGPQSALFGRNAFGGAISYTLKRPAETFEGKATVDIAEHGTQTYRLSLSGPLGGESLSYRMAATHFSTDGQYELPATGARLDEEEMNAATVSLMWIPSASVEILGRIDYSSQERSHAAITGVANNACVTVDEGPREILDYSLCEEYQFGSGMTETLVGRVPDIDEDDIALSESDFLGVENDLLRYNLQLDWDINDQLLLISNTAYADIDSVSNYDLDHLPTTADMVGVSSFTFPWVSEENPFNYHADADIQRSFLFQDTRLQYVGDGRVQWMIGAEYFDEDYDSRDFSRANGQLPRDAGDSPQPTQRDTTSWGIYTSVEMLLGEAWRLTLEGRYQYEEYEAFTLDVDATAVVPVLREDGGYGGEDDFSSFDPRVSLAWDASEDAMLYATIAKGSKPGGFTFGDGLSPENRTYEQEEVISYELGWKSTAYNNSLMFNGAVFYMDNTDKQANAVESRLFEGSYTYKDNIGEAEIYGLETSVTWLPLNNLTLEASYAYTHTEIIEYFAEQTLGVPAAWLNPDFDPRDDPDAHLDGNELPFTPEHAVRVSGQYDWALTNGIDALVRLDINYRDERWTHSDNLAKLDAYTVADFRFSMASERWDLTLYVDNLLDDQTTSNGVRFIDMTKSFRSRHVMYAPTQRQAGLRLNYNF